MTVETEDRVARAFRYGLGAAITLVFVVSVIADIFVANYDTPLALYGLMGTVVGSVFADVKLRATKPRKRRTDS